MFHEDMLYISYHKYIKNLFSCINMHCLAVHLDHFKGHFLSIFIFLQPQILDFQIVVSRPNIVRSWQTIHQLKAYLFSFHMIYTSQFREIDT